MNQGSELGNLRYNLGMIRGILNLIKLKIYQKKIRRQAAYLPIHPFIYLFISLTHSLSLS